MCPSEELRASFEYSVKRQTRLRISFFFFFSFRLCLEVECRFESPFYYAYIIRTCASIWGRRPSYSITYAQNLSAPLSLECPLCIDMYLYRLWRKPRKEKISLTRIQIKTVKENSELLDRRQVSNQRKDSFPPDIMKPFAESFAWVPSVLCTTWHSFVSNSNEMLAVARSVWGQKRMGSTAGQPLPPPPSQPADPLTASSSQASCFLI